MCDLFHGSGVEGEIGIDGALAIGGWILIAQRGNEGELGRGAAVVFLRFGMLDKGVEFAFEVFESGLSLEGFIVTEKGDDDVGLELGEPFVGCGHGAGAGVAGAPAVLGFGKGRVEFFGTGKGPG